MDYLKFAILPLVDAKNAQKQLSERGVEIRLDHNEETCKRGCAVTVELWAMEKDLPEVKRLFDQNFAKLLDGHDVEWERLNQVFDPSKEKAICPACGHEFATSDKSCPDCGLSLG